MPPSRQLFFMPSGLESTSFCHFGGGGLFARYIVPIYSSLSCFLTLGFVLDNRITSILKLS